jgi:mono/diheme cytochrome c family protein
MKNSDRKVVIFTGFIFAWVFLLCSVQAYASMKEIKAYKEAFPDAKVKCATCHTAAMPKKGAAGLNDYGKAAMAASPNTETFKKLGKAENFKK